MILKIQPITWSFIKPIIAGLFGAAFIWGLRSFVYSGTLWADLIYGLLFIAIYVTAIILLKLDAEDLLVLKVMNRKITGFITSLKGTA